MNLSKLVVAAVSFAAFALVWVPDRGGNSSAETYGARAHRALAHVAAPVEPVAVESIGVQRRFDARGPEMGDALQAVAPAPTLRASPPPQSPTRGAAQAARPTRGTDRTQPS